MKKKIYISILLGLLIALISIILIYKNQPQNATNNLSDEQSTTNTTNSLNTTNTSSTENEINIKENYNVNLKINNNNYKAIFYNNDTTKQLINKFPMTLTMSDLHSNEKYNYLNFNLPTNSSTPNKIHTGDIKLYGNNCLVVFYKDFSNTFDYTDLGYIEDIDNFILEIDSYDISITFELLN